MRFRNEADNCALTSKVLSTAYYVARWQHKADLQGTRAHATRLMRPWTAPVGRPLWHCDAGSGRRPPHQRRTHARAANGFSIRSPFAWRPASSNHRVAISDETSDRIGYLLLRCTSLFMALFGHGPMSAESPVCASKRTSSGGFIAKGRGSACRATSATSALPLDYRSVADRCRTARA
jgi:hypothetical protein